MTKFEKIEETIREYNEKEDRLYEEYKTEEKKARGKYSQQGFQTEFIMGMYPKFAGKAQSDADITVREIMYIFDEIEEDFKNWMMKPLNEEVVNVLNCINSFGLNLSMSELQIIEEKVKESYMGMKIFAGLAEKNGYHVQIPKAEEYFNALHVARDNCETAIRAYAGQAPDYPGKDLLEELKYKGATYGEYEHWHLYMAANFLHKDGEIDRLAKLWYSVNAPMTYTLTNSEVAKVKKELKKVVDGNGKIIQDKAKKLVEENPDIKSKLRSMSKEDLKEFEAVEKYFYPKEPSKLSPAMEQAANYMTSPTQTKIDENLLKQFM